MKVVPSEHGPQIGPKRVLRLRSDATAGGDPGSDGGPPSGLLDSLGLTEAAAVAEYNRDPRNQRCPECGHRNPKGYTWNPAKDGPDEAAARQLW